MTVHILGAEYGVEKMVDWFAGQKIYTAWQEAEAL